MLWLLYHTAPTFIRVARAPYLPAPSGRLPVAGAWRLQRLAAAGQHLNEPISFSPLGSAMVDWFHPTVAVASLELFYNFMTAVSMYPHLLLPSAGCGFFNHVGANILNPSQFAFSR
jgi:hypothetical protein